MGDFKRDPNGYRFIFGGMKTNASPDALPPGKYPIAINIRAFTDTELQTRPGLTRLFTAGPTSLWFTDLRAYTQLQTDNFPRILARNADDSIWLDTGTRVGTLAGSGASASAAMIPFRPNQSPQPYMYIANGSDYQKFSAPSATNVVVQQKVGIAEPQVPPEAVIAQRLEQVVSTGAGAFTAGGTASGLAGGTRVTDVVGIVLPDPAGSVQSIQSLSLSKYQQRQAIAVNGVPGKLVMDVFPSLNLTYAIASIFYFSGTTGRCVVVPATLNTDTSEEVSIYNQNLLTNLRRGSIITLGSEPCYVWSVTPGPNETVCIETSSTRNHNTTELLSGVPGIQLGLDVNPVLGQPIIAASVLAAIATGVGTLTRSAFISSPFTNLQPDDYISFGVKVDNLANLNELKILFDVSDSSYQRDFYYYTVRPSDIAAAVANSTTQLSAAQTVDQRATIDEEAAAASKNQQTTFSSAQLASGSGVWTQIVFSINELTRVGSDDSKNLQTLQSMQFLFNASGNINIEVSQEVMFFGAFAPDVGDVGDPYRYRVRPRSQVTGVVGNPSPATRYGINPRREGVQVVLPSAAYDPQIDTWDIFRIGGTITTWRFVGQTPSSNTTFADVYGDDAVGAGGVLDFDNFEPWPIVDIPNNGTASIVAGFIAIISTPDPDTASYLPGTLVQLGGMNAYTLRSRPFSLGGTTYRLEFVENAGSGTNVPYAIQEPLIANGMLPYMWGPDVSGTVFAVGDPLRPGTLYFAKNNAPDSAPDSYNIEITPPTEPLLGGEIVDGLGFTASSERWWALYPQPQNPIQRYNFVQQPVARGLAAASGHCTDGKEIFFWAKDGIWGTSRGSMTDADLYNLFPHEGVPGVDVIYNGQTAHAPNYGQAPTFRLSYSNGYLYAVYQDLADTYRMLVCNTRTGAWSVDQYAFQVSDVYHVEQPAESQSARNAPTLMAGRLLTGAGTQGSILRQDSSQNDDQSPIVCTLAVNEFDGGDLRAPKQWGDWFLDLIPAASAGVSAQPMSLGVGIVAATVIPSANVRSRLPVSVGGTLVSDFLGLMLQWTDDYTRNLMPTTLYLWQPSFDIQPARTIGWKTFGTSFGLQGFGHIQHIALAWVSTAPITLTMTTFDGQDPQPIVIPSSGGLYQKALFTLTPNKGQLFTFQATSSAPFQIFEEDIEIHVGAWSRQGPYQIFKSFGGSERAASPV